MPEVEPARRACAALGCLALLGACGFRPRGSGVEAGDRGRVFVDADRGMTITRALGAELAQRGFTLAGDRDNTDILLRLTDERVQQRIVSVQSTGRVAEYELDHSVSLALARAVGGAPPVLLPDQVTNRVQVTREYTYDETEVLGKDNEERILSLELREELVRQIVLRTLASLAPESQ